MPGAHCCSSATCAGRTPWQPALRMPRQWPHCPTHQLGDLLLGLAAAAELQELVCEPLCLGAGLLGRQKVEQACSRGQPLPVAAPARRQRRRGRLPQAAARKAVPHGRPAGSGQGLADWAGHGCPRSGWAGGSPKPVTVCCKQSRGACSCWRAWPEGRRCSLHAAASAHLMSQRAGAMVLMEPAWQAGGTWQAWGGQTELLTASNSYVCWQAHCHRAEPGTTLADWLPAGGADRPRAAYLRGMNREECVAPMPGLPCFTGL